MLLAAHGLVGSMGRRGNPNDNDKAESFMKTLNGASDRWTIFRERLPSAGAAIVVSAMLIVARAILLESYVSYLGYGIQPRTPSWGNMLNNAQQYLDSAPWLAIFPGALITIAVTSFNFLGDGLRDALDPRLELP